MNPAFYVGDMDDSSRACVAWAGALFATARVTFIIENHYSAAWDRLLSQLCTM